jgi:hypothetical protein
MWSLHKVHEVNVNRRGPVHLSACYIPEITEFGLEFHLNIFNMETIYFLMAYCKYTYKT